MLCPLLRPNVPQRSRLAFLSNPFRRGVGGNVRRGVVNAVRGPLDRVGSGIPQWDRVAASTNR